jgi:hypothetical protein
MPCMLCREALQQPPHQQTSLLRHAKQQQQATALGQHTHAKRADADAAEPAHDLVLCKQQSVRADA